VPWEVVSSLHGAFLYVRVARQSTLGNDGALSTLNQLDEFSIVESNTYGYYTGVSSGFATGWQNYPGQYFWQVLGSYSYVDSNGVVQCEFVASPVYTITVVAAPSTGGTGGTGTTGPPSAPPRLTLSNARKYAAYMVNSRLHRRLNGSIACTRISATALHCRLTWTTGRYSYVAVGRFWNYVGSDGNAYWWYDFKVTRKLVACMTHTTCSRTFRWH
jgi:hypothetical protein